MKAIRSLLINVGRVLADAGEVARYARMFVQAIFSPKDVVAADSWPRRANSPLVSNQSRHGNAHDRHSLLAFDCSGSSSRNVWTCGKTSPI